MKTSNRWHDREDGFTLVELLVVILIIGVLAAIATPAFLNQRKAAVDAAVKSDVSNVAKQLMTYDIAKYGKPGVSPVGVHGFASPLALTTNIMAAGDTTEEGYTISEGTVISITQAEQGVLCVSGWNATGNHNADNPVQFDSLDGGLGGSGGACAATPEGGIELPASATSEVNYLGALSTGDEVMRQGSNSYQTSLVNLAFDVSNASDNEKAAIENGTVTAVDGSEILALASFRGIDPSSPWLAGWTVLNGHNASDLLVLDGIYGFTATNAEENAARDAGIPLSKDVVLTYQNDKGEDVIVPFTLSMTA